MKIRTYVADNVQEAFYKVKSELGKDAVILQTKHIKKGFLVCLQRTWLKSCCKQYKFNNKPIQKPLIKSIPVFYKIKRGELTGDIKQLQNGIEQVKNMLNTLYHTKSEFYRSC